jgi:hypothetical protein
MPKSDIPLPKSQYERERERWPEVARTAVVMLGRPAEDRRLSMLLQRDFSEIPDKAQPSDDVQAYAAFAMKTLLLTLNDKREGHWSSSARRPITGWRKCLALRLSICFESSQTWSCLRLGLRSSELLSVSISMNSSMISKGFRLPENSKRN